MQELLGEGRLLEVRWNRMRGCVRGPVAVARVCCYPLHGSSRRSGEKTGEWGGRNKMYDNGIDYRGRRIE